MLQHYQEICFIGLTSILLIPNQIGKYIAGACVIALSFIKISA